MKIISKYTDYYDIYAKDRNMSDQTFRWDRTSENIKTNFSSPEVFSQCFGRWSKKRLTTDICGFNIFFCGRIIPALYVDKAENEFGYNAKVEKDYFYDIDSLPQYVKDFKNSHKSFWKKIADHFSVVNTKWTSRLPNGMTLVRKDIIDMHRCLKSPIFVNSSIVEERSDTFNEIWCNSVHNTASSIFTINPILKRFNFINHIDPFSVFLELERFLSNDMSTYRDKSDQVKISDKLKAETHGFDKFSFRKDKSTK